MLLYSVVAVVVLVRCTETKDKLFQNDILARNFNHHKIYPAVAKSPHSVPPDGLCAGETNGDRPGGGAILLPTPPGGGGKPIPDPPVRDFPVRDDSPSFFCK